MSRRAIVGEAQKQMNASGPPDGLPVYRLLTGPDDDKFCRRVSEALALGYVLYGSPAATFNGAAVVVAQAVIWPCALQSEAKHGDRQ